MQRERSSTRTTVSRPRRRARRARTGPRCPAIHVCPVPTPGRFREVLAGDLRARAQGRNPRRLRDHRRRGRLVPRDRRRGANRRGGERGRARLHPRARGPWPGRGDRGASAADRMGLRSRVPTARAARGRGERGLEASRGALRLRARRDPAIRLLQGRTPDRHVHLLATAGRRIAGRRPRVAMATPARHSAPPR